MAGGRPSTYDQDVIDLAYDYIEGFQDRNEQKRKDKDDSWEIIPSIVGLAIHIKRRSSTIYKWESEEGKEEFSEILSDVRDLQHMALVNGGLKGYLEKTITKLMLSKHGYADKVEQSNLDGGKTPKNFNSFYDEDKEE